MLQELKQQANLTKTENGAVTNESTGSECLDLFATIGALRNAQEREILLRFVRAYTENADLAMKTLFFARDVRGGLGERRVFRIIMNYLAVRHPSSVRKNLQYIAEFGRYDDLIALIGTKVEPEVISLIQEQLAKDLEHVETGASISLIAKWLPSFNASNKETVHLAKHLAKALGYKEAAYRKLLTKLRAQIGIVENNLRTRDYSFDYEKQPSKAMFKYRNAFLRNDAERYLDYLEQVRLGKVNMHAGNIYPYELVQAYIDNYGYGMEEMSEDTQNVLNTTWSALPDYGSDENVLAVVDTSGSMYMAAKPSPAAVAFSLGMYCAEHNHGLFANHFITFSGRPQLLEIKGETFIDRLSYLMTFNEIANTNLEAVFNLILETAVKNDVPQEELPAKLVIISDMEFDEGVDHASLSIFEGAKKTYERFGYKLPTVVFWNVASRNRQQPVTMNEQGVALVSGASPRIFEMVTGSDLNPYTFMLDILGSERYACIAA